MLGRIGELDEQIVDMKKAWKGDPNIEMAEVYGQIELEFSDSSGKLMHKDIVRGISKDQDLESSSDKGRDLTANWLPVHPSGLRRQKVTLKVRFINTKGEETMATSIEGTYIDEIDFKEQGSPGSMARAVAKAARTLGNKVGKPTKNGLSSRQTKK